MARLLVSVRSADEAQAALDGGADIIDVKEPRRGPLGWADPAIWSEIRCVVPATIPMSVALGEAAEWSFDSAKFLSPKFWRGITFAKLGLAGLDPDWISRWMSLRAYFEKNFPEKCSWVAVIYADWELAKAPPPDQILNIALENPRFRGVLVDTWSKGVRPNVEIAPEWQDRGKRVKDSGRFLAWAGGLGISEIERFNAWNHAPDIIAVRGAACRGGDRLGTIDPSRVALLKRVARI